MAARKPSLLERAMAVPGPVRGRPAAELTEEHLELAIAYLQGRITGSQIMTARIEAGESIGSTRQNAHVWASMIVARAIRSGKWNLFRVK